MVQLTELPKEHIHIERNTPENIALMQQAARMFMGKISVTIMPLETIEDAKLIVQDMYEYKRNNLGYGHSRVIGADSLAEDLFRRKEEAPPVMVRSNISTGPFYDRYAELKARRDMQTSE